MTAEEVLALATELGHSVKVNGENLTLCGPAQPETPMLLRVLKLHKPEIIKRLTPQGEKPLDRKEFRKRLETFWAETGWTPLGGWNGERDRPTESY